MALISISNRQTKANHCNKVQAVPPYFLFQAWVLQKAEMLWKKKKKKKVPVLANLKSDGIHDLAETQLEQIKTQ